MDNSFLKQFNSDDIENYLKDSSDNSFFKNISELKDLLNFYKSSTDSLCLINGPFGTFKTELLNMSLKFLSEDVLVFKYECFEATCIDDIFLAVFNDLKEFLQNKKIKPSKIETDSLSKKINFYLSHIEKPAVFILDSFENLDKNQNKPEILSFIEHISAFSNFKVVVLSRNQERLDNKNFYSIFLKPFEKEEVKKFFESVLINTEPEFLDKLYDYTQGNTSYIVLTAKIISSLRMPLKTLLADFDKKKFSYEEFILQKLLAFASENDRKSLSVLALSKMGFSKEFLCNQCLFTKEKLNYLLDKGVLSYEGGYVFLKSYLKEYLTPYISHFEKINIHQYLKNFYESQLPLKPSQRAIPISRNTMRAQSAYHNTFLPENFNRPSLDTAYLGYMNSNTRDWDIPEPVQKPQKKQEKPQRHNPMEKYALTQEELALLGLPIDLSKSPALSQPVANQLPVKQEQYSLSDLIEQAEELLKNHEYNSALDILSKAMQRKDELGFKENLPYILKNSALCSKKMNNIDESVSFLYKLYDFYFENNLLDRGNDVLLEIAQTYKDSYRFIKAKEIYDRFLNSKLPVSDRILAYSYIGRAEIEEDSSDIQNAMQDYGKAFQYAKSINDKAFLSEAYFKYALILDDNNQIDNALNYYEKCTELNDPANTFISSAYTNIAEIYKERRDLSAAFKNYRLALKYDTEASNYEGIYYLCTKLAAVCAKVRPDLRLNFLLKALSAAKRIQDKFYIINSYIEVGDYYYKVKNDEKALKAYLLARNILTAQEEFRPDDLKTIDVRIMDLKIRMDRELFKKLSDEISERTVDDAV